MEKRAKPKTKRLTNLFLSCVFSFCLALALSRNSTGRDKFTICVLTPLFNGSLLVFAAHNRFINFLRLFMLVTKRKTKNTADVTRKPLIPA
jgi:hypothetical protein